MVNKNDTFSSLKNQIQQQTDVYPDHMQLKINGSHFQDDDCISDFLKDNDKVIKVITQNDLNKIIHLNFVNMNKEQQFTLKFIPKYEVQQVIDRLAIFLNTKPYQIDVFYENTPLNPTDSLFDYSIHDGSIIKFKTYDGSSGSYPIKIKNTYSGESYTVDVLSSYTIDDLVSKIHEQIDLLNSITHLVMEGRVLYPSYNNLKLRELGIKEGSILHIMFRYY